MTISISDLKPNIENTTPQRIAPTPLPRQDVQVRLSDVEQRLSPFGIINVYPVVDNKTTVVVWEKHTDWKHPLSGKLHLEYSEDPAFGSYITVRTMDISPKITDRSDRFKGQQIKGAYRLKLVLSSEEFISSPFPVMGHLGYTDYRTLLKIERAEMRNKHILTEGVLLKKKQMGDACPQCLNDLLKQPHKTNCPVCFNTGFVGGYYPPARCDVVLELSAAHDQVDPQVRGPINDQEVSARILAYHQPVTFDVWCNLRTGDRYRITSVKNIVQIKTVPIVHTAQMRRIPNSDIAYSLSVE
jgi:hypothetical protein